jgi:dTDP-4-dehydrorhamnose 3,5-epimerase
VRIEELDIKDSFLITPELYEDDRGCFFEAMRVDLLDEIRGEEFRPAQMNISMSREGTLRGIHASAAPAGQSKYVTCVAGSIVDVVVDLSRESKTFGRWSVVELDSSNGRCVFVPPWAGHAFLATSHLAKVVYLTSSTYSPDQELAIDALDRDLAIPWPWSRDFVRSTRDREAQSFASFRQHLDSMAPTGQTGQREPQ